MLLAKLLLCTHCRSAAIIELPPAYSLQRRWWKLSSFFFVFFFFVAAAFLGTMAGMSFAGVFLILFSLSLMAALTSCYYSFVQYAQQILTTHGGVDLSTGRVTLPWCPISILQWCPIAHCSCCCMKKKRLLLSPTHSCCESSKTPVLWLVYCTFTWLHHSCNNCFVCVCVCVCVYDDAFHCFFADRRLILLSFTLGLLCTPLDLQGLDTAFSCLKTYDTRLELYLTSLQWSNHNVLSHFSLLSCCCVRGYWHLLCFVILSWLSCSLSFSPPSLALPLATDCYHPTHLQLSFSSFWISISSLMAIDHWLKVVLGVCLLFTLTHPPFFHLFFQISMICSLVFFSLLLFSFRFLPVFYLEKLHSVNRTKLHAAPFLFSHSVLLLCLTETTR